MKGKTFYKLILLAVYLSGCVCSYKEFKRFDTYYVNEWTNGDRAFGLAFSSTSWIGAVTMLCADIVLHSEYMNEPANW